MANHVDDVICCIRAILCGAGGDTPNHVALLAFLLIFLHVQVLILHNKNTLYLRCDYSLIAS